VSDALRQAVAGRQWYHTLELAPGIVTPGWFDTRRVVARLPFPASLAGKRCLDVGTFDGFWAFEMERRGADEVIAVDILDPERWDWPAGSDAAIREHIGERKERGEGFEIARDALGSSVVRRARSVYDLNPSEDGEFDFAYLGSLLLHLRDPVRALSAVASVCRGEVLVVDAIDPVLERSHSRRALATIDGQGRPWWYRPNVAGLVRMVRAAGLEPIGRPLRLRMPPGAGQEAVPLRPRLLLRRAGREAAVYARRGDLHAAVLARPAHR
jgi:tRNA (mo5U34)-methyltransferase